MKPFTPTERTTLHRIPNRGRYDRAVVEAILDDGLVCHLAFVVDGQPYTLPTTFARLGDTVYVHGAAASRMLKTLAQGVPVCVTVTLLDGLVLARSAFHHSMNYRSVVILGTAREVTDLDERNRALAAIVDRAAAGRWEVARLPNAKELAATRVLAVPLEEVSAKVRTGGPIDDEEDLGLEIWAGVVPLALRAEPPIPADGIPASRPGPPVDPRFRRPG
jgi:nitroimidazol reductase NimA-like FMN-containing flavoprotein (pyridoxamine 5'-phosphate oxidase superfamily)